MDYTAHEILQVRILAAAAAAAAKSLQSCPTLCDPIDGSPPGSAIPGILQARTLESGLPLPSPMQKSESEVAQSCLTLSDPMDCSLPGSSADGIFQARVLEWVDIAFSDVCSRFLKRIMPLFPTLVMEKNLIIGNIQ